MRSARHLLVLLSAAALMLGPSSRTSAQDADTASPPAPLAADAFAFQAMGAPAHPKVPVLWNRFYDVEGLAEILRRIHEAYPTLTRLYSIGESWEGREIWCLEVSAFAVGDAERKPGMYIDGNIHGNEVQGGEAVAYTAWYLCENYGRVPRITQMLDERIFYLLPSINPDGRDDWFHNRHAKHNQHTSRGGKKPLDNDEDGLFDEDDVDDLDGDGHITEMRRRDPRGRYKTHPEFADLMVEVKREETGEFELLGWEGIDNDGDGRVNEDGVGGYDPNRNWPWDWQPEYVQGGSRDFPTSLPETKAVIDFVIAHPNIAAGQSYHNAGGMILRPPGREGGRVAGSDESLMRHIAERGGEMLPFYRVWIVWKDLYTVWGGEFEWFYAGRGILTFTNELWTDENWRRGTGPGVGGQERERIAARDLLLDEPVVAWKPFNHPLYGEVEIGGYKKELGRVPPSFMLEEECHRNMAFTLYHADQMPRLQWGEVTAERVGDGLVRVRAEVQNTRTIPTRLGIETEINFNRPDLFLLEPASAVVSGGIVKDRWTGEVEPVEHRPAGLEIATVPGMGSVRVQFVARAGEPLTLTFDSLKGGVLTMPVPDAE